jgi:hypothetical protein
MLPRPTGRCFPIPARGCRATDVCHGAETRAITLKPNNGADA